MRLTSPSARPDYLKSLCLLLLALAACGGSGGPAPPGPGPDKETRIERFRNARHFMYQLQGLEEDGAVEALAATHYDIVVVEPSNTVKGSEEFDARGMVTQLKSSENSRGGQKLVLAYINIGQAEDYRTYWQDDWVAPTSEGPGLPEFMLSVDPDGWPGNYPVAFWDQHWQDVVIDAADSLLQQAISAGFDGVYMDWVDAYSEEHVVAAADNAGVDPAAAMVDFIGHLRLVARSVDPEFLVVQQNAPYLKDNALGLASVIDGIALEDIWFLGDPDAAWGDPRGGDLPQDASGDYSTAALIAKAQAHQGAGIKVLTIDYCLNASNAVQVYAESEAQGFTPLVTQISLERITQTAPPWY